MTTKFQKIRAINEAYHAATKDIQGEGRMTAIIEHDKIKMDAMRELFVGVPKPIITLTKISHNARLSEETPAYTAIINVDGKPFCEVSNHGHGGGDNYYALKSDKSPTHISERVVELDALIQVTYPMDSQYHMEETLECLCFGIVYDAADLKKFKSLIKRKTLTHDRGKIYQFKGNTSPAQVAAVKKQNPNHIVLNELPVEEAFALYKKHG